MKTTTSAHGCITDRYKTSPFVAWQTREKEPTERQQRRIINNKHKRRRKGVV